MPLRHSKASCILFLPSLVSVLAEAFDLNTASPLPAPLQDAVPACAQPCLRSTLLGQFPTSCTAPLNIDCLCTRYSTGGDTLGEAALQCIYTSCPDGDNDDHAASAYNICLGKDNAVPPTQTALTITVAASTSTSTSTTAGGLKVDSTSTPQTEPTNVGVANVSSTTPGMLQTDSATSQTAVPVAAGTNPEPSTPTMKPAQIAGLAVAVAASFILAIGLMALSVWLRRRREQKHDEAFGDPAFGDEESGFWNEDMDPKALVKRRKTTKLSGQLVAPKQFPMFPEHPVHPRYTASTVIVADPDGAQTFDPSVSEKVRHFNRPFSTASQPKAVKSFSPVDQIGVAVSSESEGATVGPAATLPSLPQLPRKASLRQQRPQSLRLATAGLTRDTVRSHTFPMDNDSRDSVLSQDTVFEEEYGSARRRSSVLLPTPPISIPPLRPLRSSKFNSSTLLNEGSPDGSIKYPELSLNIPVRHSRTLRESISYKPSAVLDSPIRLSSGSKKAHTRNMSSTYGINADIPDYYFATERSSRDLSRTAPALRAVKVKKSASTVSRATSHASTNVRESFASDTSFESVYSDDPTPEVEDNRQLASGYLSPVVESPISQLRYPKVPRASNQLVARSPRNSSSPQKYESPRRLAHPSALLMKRRGETDAVRPLEFPSRQQHDYQSQQQTPGFDAMKSPGWVPNLTPKRQGEDLILDVSYSKPAH
ncbi:hypothetical protein M011DRAFT_527262 [Sporormia fimetaria CBS 119925]|uniref:CFEM domain-containing protein n=1 Tax=Sporormia fimetaria CBS 119925 TaxID=1340428 RepID=A0A6A6V8R9_9PLEO|nr:hypothetical protein M011DRAFT_527262 [Sporormia fimetaria CBS 119925]